MAPAALNKGASVPSPTWRTSWLGSATELEARLPWLGRHGGGGDQALDFACSRSVIATAVRPPASSEDLGALYSGVWPAGGVFDGVDGGGFRMLAVPALGLRALVGGAEVFRRRCRLDAAMLWFGKLGVHPRPMCHRDTGLVVCDGEHKRSIKQLGCEEAFPDLGFVASRLLLRLRRRRMQATFVGSLLRGLQGAGCNFLFLGVLCAKCPDSWLFWAVLGATCDVLSLFAI